MPYRFRLQTVLRLRAAFEQQEERRLQQIAQELQVCERELTNARSEWLALKASQIDALANGLASSELSFYAACFHGLRLRQQQLQSRRKQLQMRWQEQRNALQAARGKREVLEKLRDQEAIIYRREQQRREQAEADDLFATKHLRRDKA